MSHPNDPTRYDPLPLTNDDHHNTLYNAPPSPDPNISTFHTPATQPTDLPFDPSGIPPGASHPRFLGAALYDDPNSPRVRDSYASSHNTYPSGGNGSEFNSSVYALNDTLGSSAPLAQRYHDDPDGYVAGERGALPMSPVGQSTRFMEEKRTAYAAPRAKSKRKVIILAVLVSLILLILAVVIPVYFAVVKPNSDKNSANDSADSTSSTAKPSGTGKPKAPPVAAVVTGGDGSTVTMEDGTTFTYNNPFGGYWYWDENDPFNNGARSQSWSAALNETFKYGIDKIRGYAVPSLTPSNS